MPPYSEPRDKKNKKWVDLSINLQKWLEAHFHKGNELAMPNPLYPKQTRFDKIFRISNFQWKFLPKSLDNLTGKNPPFKFAKAARKKVSNEFNLDLVNRKQFLNIIRL